MMQKLKLEDDGFCFACGSKNNLGLKLKFVLDKDRAMHTEFYFAKQYQGYKDIVHGGMVALILDELMGNLCWKLGKNAIAAEIQVRFKRPTPVSSRLYFKSWIEKEAKGIIYMKAEAKDKDGRVAANASGKAVRLKTEP